MDRTRALDARLRLAQLLAAVTFLGVAAPTVAPSRTRSSEPTGTCRFRGSGRVPPLHAVGARDPRARLELVGFETELDLGAAGVRRHARVGIAALPDVRVLSPIAFVARLDPEAQAPFGVYFDTGYSAFEGMFEVATPIEGIVERWTRTHVVTRLPLSSSGTLTVTTPCADVRWGAPIDGGSQAVEHRGFDSRVALHRDVAFRMSASPSSAVLFSASSGEGLLPGMIVATASRFSLVRIHDGHVALEGWVPTSSVRSVPERSDPAMGGLDLRDSHEPTAFEVDASVAWLDVWLTPGTAVYDDDDATQPVGQVSERVRVVLLHRPGARRAALHMLTRESGPCERMRGAARARCDEIASRDRTVLLRVSEEARDSTGENGRHFFYVDAPGREAEVAP